MSRTMLELIEYLSPLRMAPNSPDTNVCIQRLQEELPFTVHEFAADSECNGWVVPKSWYPKKAEIRNSAGELIYDGMHHPLAVIGYSRSFSGVVDRETLRKHLFYTEVFDDALVYHCDLFYKPYREEWGFSVPKRFFDSLADDNYTVTLETAFEQDTMKVAEYTLPGETDDCIIINAHNCHAFVCNDDLSGIAIGIDMMRALAKWEKRRYTYKLIVAPEHFGSIFYLNSLSEADADKLKWGMFLESLGTNQPIALQRSFTGTSLIDRALLNVFKNGKWDWRTELFRKVVGNDETCWEAAGFEIPFPSLSRMPFPEYHTSRDNPRLMGPKPMG